MKSLIVENCAALSEYGMHISEFSILGPVGTSQVVLGSLISLDVPTQVKWHMCGLIRNNGNKEQLKYAIDITTEICKVLEMPLKSEISALAVLREENLF